MLERFSFECRKVIGFALSTRCDWLKRFAPPFHPIRSKTKANCDALARFSRALRQPHVITSSFDWFNVLSVSYVIGQSNYFGFGFTTLKRKPLYCNNIDFKSQGVNRMQHGQRAVILNAFNFSPDTLPWEMN